MPLALVIQRAFHFQEFQFSSHAPCCLGRFDFGVRLPEGAARDEFDRMLQNLLRERFKLAFHYGTKEMSGYELTLAPKGPAFRETTQPGKPPEGRKRWTLQLLADRRSLQAKTRTVTGRLTRE